jgi:hypothetical protein
LVEAVDLKSTQCGIVAHPVYFMESDAEPYGACSDEWRARHPNTPPEVLARLAKSPDGWVRYKVAINPSTPIDIIIELAADPDWNVNYGIVFNPNTPAEILVRLAEHKDIYIRDAVVAHQNTPEVVRFWLKSGYAGLSLAEFLNKVNDV